MGGGGSAHRPIAGGSGVAEEGFEAAIHVLLDVEEGEAWLVGGEVDGGASVVGTTTVSLRIRRFATLSVVKPPGETPFWKLDGYFGGVAMFYSP